MRLFSGRIREVGLALIEGLVLCAILTLMWLQVSPASPDRPLRPQAAQTGLPRESADARGHLPRNVAERSRIDALAGR